MQLQNPTDFKKSLNEGNINEYTDRSFNIESHKCEDIETSKKYYHNHTNQ